MVKDLVGLSAAPGKGALRAMIRLLKRRCAISAPEIAHQLSMDRFEVEAVLRELLRTDRIECLRPIGLPRREPIRVRPTDDLDYYRWKFDTDQRHLWQCALRSSASRIRLHRYVDVIGLFA